MNKTWLVFRNEFISAVTRKSFLVTLFLFPLIGLVVTLVIGGLQNSSGADASTLLNDLMMPSVKNTLEGFVDQSGIIKAIPAGYENRLTRYPSEEAARADLSAEKIAAYYIITADYMNTGEVIYVRPDFNPMGGSIQSTSLDALLAYNLTGGDLNLYYRVQNPLNANTTTIDTTASERDENNPLTFILPYIVAFLFYIEILTSASLLLNSISSEKNNRVMEVLMTSITPIQMLTGKILALGLVGLLQTVVWFGSTFAILRFSAENYALADAFQLPTSILLWGVLFFVFGYTIYASLMAGIGALVPGMREASQLTTIVILPMIVPLMFITTLIQTPNATLSIVLSLFPLTSPVAMMCRLAATAVPLWQILAALALLVLTAFYFIRVAAGLFKEKNLLGGNTVKTKDFLRAFIGKA